MLMLLLRARLHYKSPQLLRFSAFGIGIVYGAYRYNSLCAYVKKRAERREIEHKIKLAEDGKILYQAYMNEKLRAAAEKSGESRNPTRKADIKLINPF